MRRAAAAMFLVAVFATAAAAQEQGSMVGTWTLNVAKSDFGKQPAPKSATLQITDDKATSLKWTFTQVRADGTKLAISYDGAFDGKPHPVVGDPNVKSATFTRKGDTAEIVWTMADGTTTRETSTVKGDVMTNRETTPAGTMTMVFERNGGAARGMGK